MEIIYYDMNITPKQMELYAAIKEHIAIYKYSPTVRELCKALGGKSTGTVLPALRLLRKKGYIDYEDNKSRTIRIVKEVKYGKY